MKLYDALSRLGALWLRRKTPRTRRRAVEPDPAEMGTAFGLDSTITLLGPAYGPEGLEAARPPRRLRRR